MKDKWIELYKQQEPEKYAKEVERLNKMTLGELLKEYREFHKDDMDVKKILVDALIEHQIDIWACLNFGTVEVKK